MLDLRAGDIIKVFRKVKEGNKERTQIFEGIIISVKGMQSSSPMVTVRRIAYGTGVEITVPLYSPSIEKVERVKRAGTRKSKLYYLRKKGFKLSKLKMKELGEFVAAEEEKKYEIQDEIEKDENQDESEAQH